MIASSRTYAIGMVHFLIGGGWKALAIVITVYVCLFAAGMALFYFSQYLIQGSPRDYAEIARIIVVLLTGIQVMALLLAGGYRVANSISTDISSRMLESHRLMPVASTNAAWGYIFGPTTVTVFALVNLVLSLTFAALNHISVERLLIHHVVLFAFAVFVWSFIALATFIYRHSFMIGLIAVLLGTCTTILFYAFILFPALGLVMTPFLGDTVFDLGFARTSTSPLTLAVGLLGQAALFIIYFFGTCRLYRGTFRLVFNEPQALALLAVWALLSAFGISVSNEIGIQLLFRRVHFDPSLGQAQVVASVTSCILIAVVPLWTLIQTQRRYLANFFLQMAAVTLIGLLAAAPALGAGWLPTCTPSNVLLTLLIALTHVFIIYCVLHMARNKRFYVAALITAGVLLLLWIGPLVLELIRIIIAEQQNARVNDDLTVLGTSSPIGFLAALWDESTLPLAPGAIIQVAIAVLFGALTAGLAQRKMTPATEVLPVPAPLHNTPRP